MAPLLAAAALAVGTTTTTTTVGGTLDNPITDPTSTVILKGGNVTVKPAHFNTTTYPLGVWAALWSEWDWNGWIKPQIDGAQSLGSNTVRVFGSQRLLFSAFADATYWARWDQLCAYVDSLGMMLYATFGDLHPDHWDSTVSSANNAAAVSDWAALLAAHGNTVGIDITNESNMAGGNATVLETMIPAAQAHGFPVTQSLAIRAGYQWGSETYPGNVLNLVDFHDSHIYYDGLSTTDVALWRARGAAYQKPIVLGEFGAPMSLASAARTGRYTAANSLLAADETVRGALQWALQDQQTTPSEQWGIYDASWVLRTDIGTPFAAMPVVRT